MSDSKRIVDPLLKEADEILRSAFGQGEQAKMSEELPVENEYGGCPECGFNDGYLNIESEHWFFCDVHETKWRAGSNLFPDSEDESEDDWSENERKLKDFEEVEPLPFLEEEEAEPTPFDESGSGDD